MKVGNIVRLHPKGEILMESRREFNKTSLQDLILNALKRDNTPESIAAEITGYYGTDSAFPIGDLARTLGFRILIRKLSKRSLSGYIACDDKLTIPRLIVVNADDNYGHQRFTIAHELWHYCKRIGEIDSIAKEKGYYSPYDTDPKAQDAEELEANRFAANLLMPIEEFKIAYQGATVLKISYDSLKERFGVSRTAIDRRAHTLGLV